MSKITTWLLDNSLWLAALGLMGSSSGIDGAYMSRMMEPGLWPLGYVLNTVSDVSGMILMYWFGRLRQERKGSKRYRLSLALLPAEAIAIAYSWLFSWRQLLMILPAVEGQDAKWVAPIAAGFIPLLLAFIGLGQALREGRFDGPVAAKTEKTAEVAFQPDIPLYIVGTLPDTKWTQEDFVRLVPDPAALTPAMRLELSAIARVHPRTVGRWADKVNGGGTK